MPNQASAAVRALEADIVSRLAKFFPGATAVRIPIQISGSNRPDSEDGKATGSRWCPIEETIIEFGTPREILFLAKHRLEFADVVLVESEDGLLRAETSVVAAQYYPERTVIAARFLKDVPNWIVKS
ncbi:MAG: hypothetical protein WAL71_00510 [Terriglobales bacterium]